MSDSKRTYVYGNLEIKYDASLTPEEVQRIWASIYPELKNSRIIDHGDYVEFVEQPGTKG